MEIWYVYIAECNDGTLYTGTAKYVNKRIEKHNSGKGALYTKLRRPIRVVYSCAYENRSLACKEEYRIKQLTRLQKLKMINNE